jgi:fucose permease
MSVASAAAVRPSGRDAVTWYAYLLLGYYAYVISLQGNILPFLRDELALSYRDVSLHTSAIAAGVMIIGFFGERALRLLGRRRTLVAATVGSAGAMVLLTLAPVVAVSLAACFLFGLIGSLIQVIVQGVLADYEGRWRDVAIAESNAMACLFATAAPIVTGIAVWLDAGWRMAVLAGVAAGLIILAVFHRLPIPERAATRTAGDGRLGFAYWCYWAVLGLGVAVEFAAILWAPAYLEQVVGLDPSAAAIAATAVFAGMLVGRVGGAGLFRMFPTRHLFFAAAVTVFVGFAAYRGSTEPAVVIGGLFVLGLGAALLFPLSLTFAIGAAGPAAQRGSARILIAAGLAILLGPPLLGAIADAAGLRAAMLMIPVFMALAVGAFLLGEAARHRAARAAIAP